MGEIVYPKLSYAIIGLLFRVYNELGYGHQEKHYQRAFKKELEKNKFQYKQEVLSPLIYKDQSIGRYFLDFVIENKIAVELKVANDFYKKHLRQILDYLKTTNLKLGILVIFTKKGLKYKRVANSRKFAK